jgi:hypothetical protein
MFHPFGLVVVVGEPIIALSNPVLRNLRSQIVNPRAQESCPTVRLHCIQRRDYVVECIGLGDVAAIIDSEEEFREVIERLLPAAQLADFRVGIEPDEVRLRGPSSPHKPIIGHSASAR